jgi:O-acetyl-ADP-ribose deacetylase (regulator of RNase III)
MQENKFEIELNEQSTLTVIQKSVLDIKADAIVNAANSTLLGGGGVDGAIHRAAGPKLLEECRTLHGCTTGGAKITGAYNLMNAKYIIHAVGPIYSGETRDAALLASCYETALNLAIENNCASIAFPCISMGVYGYPINEAVEVSVKALQNWFESHPDAKMNVTFACFRPIEFESYQQYFLNI